MSKVRRAAGLLGLRAPRETQPRQPPHHQPRPSSIVQSAPSSRTCVVWCDVPRGRRRPSHQSLGSCVDVRLVIRPYIFFLPRRAYCVASCHFLSVLFRHSHLTPQNPFLHPYALSPLMRVYVCWCPLCHNRCVRAWSGGQQGSGETGPSVDDMANEHYIPTTIHGDDVSARRDGPWCIRRCVCGGWRARGAARRAAWETWGTRGASRRACITRPPAAAGTTRATRATRAQRCVGCTP